MVIDPPATIHEEILRIREATAARNYWAVLGIPPKSSFREIKSAQRRWIRKLHPDKWFTNPDEHLRAEIQEAYYQVQAAYFESLKHCAGIQHDPITPPPPTSNTPVVHHSLTWIQLLFSFLFHRTTPKTA